MIQPVAVGRDEPVEEGLREPQLAEGESGSPVRSIDRIKAVIEERFGFVPLADSNLRLAAAQRWFSQAAGIAVGILGFLVLAGWTLDISMLKSVSSSLPSMKANAAIGLILAGASLYIITGEYVDKRRQLAAGICALLVALVGWFTASEYLFGQHLGIDQILFKEPVGAVATSDPGRMDPTTAFNLFLLGVALLVLDFRRTFPVAQLLTLAAGTVSLLILIGYAYGVGSVYAENGHTQMAVHTSAAFVLLCLGVLVSRPDRGIFFVLNSNAAGGVLARRLLPASLVIPIVLGWLVLTGQRTGAYQTEFGLSVLVMATIISFALLTWWNAGSQYRLDLERRRAEDELNRGQAQLAEAQRIAHLGSAEWDMVANTVSWSDELYRIYGLSPEEVTASYEAFLQQVHPDDRDLVKQSIEKSLRTGEPFSFDYRIVRPDRAVRVVHGEGKVIRDDSGKVVRVTGTGQDITERKRIEFALRKSEARTRSIIDSANDAFIAIDQGGRVTDWNPQAEAAFGWSREEAVGKTLAELIIPDRFRETHREGLHRFLTTHEGPVLNKRLELPALHRDGHEFPVELTISVVGSGRSYMFTAFVRDITERKQSEEALQKQAEALARTNAELEDFTHSVSHDLKEPLRGIEAFAGFLAEDYGDKLDEQGQRYVTVLRESAVRMKDLIEDLLQLSRIGRAPVEYQPVPISALVEDIKLELQFAIQEKNADLRIDSNLPTVPCDKTRIREVFMNLISNAIKYNDKPQPVAEVSCRQDNGAFVFSIKDNGIGIEEQYHEKIFRIFQRLHHREEYEGTGVGLTICKKIVEAHKGKIWVESVPGEGTTFFFSIPRLARERQSRKEEPVGQSVGAH